METHRCNINNKFTICPIEQRSHLRIKNTQYIYCDVCDIGVTVIDKDNLSRPYMGFFKGKQQLISKQRIDQREKTFYRECEIQEQIVSSFTPSQSDNNNTKNCNNDVFNVRNDSAENNDNNNNMNSMRQVGSRLQNLSINKRSECNKKSNFETEKTSQSIKSKWIKKNRYKSFRPKHKYCQVCRISFEDYEQHVKLLSHAQCADRSVGMNFIKLTLRDIQIANQQYNNSDAMKKLNVIAHCLKGIKFSFLSAMANQDKIWKGQQPFNIRKSRSPQRRSLQKKNIHSK